MNTGDATLILIEGDRSASRPSPYINKFGETFMKNSTKFDRYTLSKAIMGDVRKTVTEFRMGHDVVNRRCNTDRVWRLRIM